MQRQHAYWMLCEAGIEIISIRALCIFRYTSIDADALLRYVTQHAWRLSYCELALPGAYMLAAVSTVQCIIETTVICG